MNSPEPATSPAHILIAEDSGVQAYMLRRILEQEGHKTSVANNGRLALELAAQIRPALVVSDVNMPEMSGYELCRQIKANPDLCHIPVILVTNLSDPDDVLLGLKSGADSFVIKPYDKTHMLARVQHALSNQRLPTEAEKGPGVDIFFHGQTHQITASRAQILNLLMSTYDATAQRNRELHESREQLAERTAELLAANRFLDSIIENIPNMIFIKDAAELKFVRLTRAGEH
jgi:DNA-binding response OmpR family regulator